MKSLIIHASSIDELTHKIDEASNFKTTLAFIYTSSSYNIRELVTQLNKYPFLVYGSTTAGELSADANNGAMEQAKTIVCMLLDINPSAIALKLFPAQNDKYYEMGKEVGQWINSNFSNAGAITVTSGLQLDTESFAHGIASNNIEDIFGGIAGDDFALEETFVFSKENFSDHGVIVLAIDKDKINIAGARAFGWAGVGAQKVITKSDKNIVYEIDNKPAVDFYTKYLNIVSSDMPGVGLEYPLEVNMPDGNIAYRACLAFNDSDGSLIFGGHVEENSRVKIATVKGAEIIHSVTDSIVKVLDDNKFTPEIGLLFPCCSRKSALAEQAIKEIKTIYDVSKVPLIGFYAYGEIGFFSGGYGFQNETFVTAFLSEKEN